MKRYKKEHIIAIVHNIVDYTLQNYLGITIPFSEVKENLSECGIEGDVIDSIDEIIHDNLDTKTNVSVIPIQPQNTTDDIPRIEAIEIACQILVGDENEEDNDFIFALTEEEKSLILRYRTKLHDYIKEGVFDDI